MEVPEREPLGFRFKLLEKPFRGFNIGFDPVQSGPKYFLIGLSFAGEGLVDPVNAVASFFMDLLLKSIWCDFREFDFESSDLFF
jgi:hypothetical protein